MRQPYWAGAPSLVDDLAAAALPYNPYGAAPAGYAPPGYALVPHPGYMAPPPMPRVMPPMPHPYYPGVGYQQPAGYAGTAVPYRRIMPQIPGVPALGFRDQAVGLGSDQFNASSAASLQLVGSPGRPFKGRRLLTDVTRTGTSATGLMTLTKFQIGDSNQLNGQQPLLFNAYGPTSFGVDHQLSACAPALPIILEVAITALPTMSDTVDIAAQINGETIGG